MLVKRNPKPVEPAKPRLDLVNFREAGRILGGLPERTVRDKAVEMGLTVVNLNDGLPFPVLKKNYLRLVKQEVEAVRDKAIETAKGHHDFLNRIIEGRRKP